MNRCHYDKNISFYNVLTRSYKRLEVEGYEMCEDDRASVTFSETLRQLKASERARAFFGTRPKAGNNNWRVISADNLCIVDLGDGGY